MEPLVRGLPEGALLFGQLDGILMDLGVSSMQVRAMQHTHQQ